MSSLGVSTTKYPDIKHAVTGPMVGDAVRGQIVAATPPVAVEETAWSTPGLHPTPRKKPGHRRFQTGNSIRIDRERPEESTRTRHYRGSASHGERRRAFEQGGPSSIGLVLRRRQGRDDARDIRAARDWPKQLLGIPQLDGWIHNQPRPFG
jgi:hypothetical protein